MAKFKLVESFEFWWPVKARQPSETRPGHFDEATINCKFKRISQERIKEIGEAFEALETDEERIEHQDDLLREVLIDWKPEDLAGDDKQPVPFSEVAREAAIADVAFKVPAYKAYIKAASGGAFEGN